jgi:hypothetical protein
VVLFSFLYIYLFVLLDLGRRLDGDAARRRRGQVGRRTRGQGGAATHSAGMGRGPAGGGDSPRVPTRASARRTAASGVGAGFSSREPAEGQEIPRPERDFGFLGARFRLSGGLSFSDEHRSYNLGYRRESAHLDFWSLNLPLRNL